MQVIGCSACGQDHQAVEPVHYDETMSYGHFVCPETNRKVQWEEVD